jgi:hypothetical protein
VPVCYGAVGRFATAPSARPEANPRPASDLAS